MTVTARPRRIAFVSTGLAVGGAETMLHRVATRLDRDRFELMVISVMDEGEFGPALRSAGIPVATVGFTNRIPTPDRAARLLRPIRSFRPDVVAGWMYHGNLAASIARRWAAPRAALAWNIRHSVYDLGNERAVTRQLIRLGARWSAAVDSTVYVSETSRRQHEALGYRSPAVVIGNGIDPAPLAAPAERAAVRAELGFGPTDVVIGHVARYHPMKDHATFLRAAADAAAAEPSLRLLLVGRDVTAANPALRPILDAPALAGRVTMLGERRDVDRLLGAMDAFCLSSSSEGFPNVVLEAAVAGLPCVVTDVGAAPEIPGDGGLVVPPRDARAMAGGLREIVGMGTEGRAVLGTAARARAIACFSLDATVAAHADLLERLADGRRRD